jgi:hypothetical protein
MHSRRCLLLAFALIAGCSRRAAPAAPPVTAARLASVETEREREREREREHGPFGEHGAEEIMERQRDLSAYAPDEAGLTQLLRDVVSASGQNDRARLEELLGAVTPDRQRLSLAFTFEGDRTLSPYLTGPNAASRDELVNRALRWGRMTTVTVHAASGSEIVQGTPAAAALDPGVRRIGAMLRPQVRFYRATLAEPGTRESVVLESFVYAGGRWLFVPEPWRFAPGEPARGTVSPVPAWGSRVNALPGAH